LQDAYYAVVVDDDSDEGLLVAHVGIGNASVNEGEYRGVIAALRWIADADLDTRAVVITDSQLVHGHVIKAWRCSKFDQNGQPSILPVLRDTVRYLLWLTDSELFWKSRNRNLAGFFFQGIVDARRKEKYRLKKEGRRAKRKKVREWTFDNPETSGYGAGRAPRLSVEDLHD
jgi:ribonuclease HI